SAKSNRRRSPIQNLKFHIQSNTSSQSPLLTPIPSRPTRPSVSRWLISLLVAIRFSKLLSIVLCDQPTLANTMNKTSILSVVTFAFCSMLVPVTGRAQDIDSMPPVVVKTIPEAGATNVSPGTIEIKVTFSKEMADGSWSWIEPWKGANGNVVGKPKYES